MKQALAHELSLGICSNSFSCSAHVLQFQETAYAWCSFFEQELLIGGGVWSEREAQPALEITLTLLKPPGGLHWGLGF